MEHLGHPEQDDGALALSMLVRVKLQRNVAACTENVTPHKSTKIQKPEFPV